MSDRPTKRDGDREEQFAKRLMAWRVEETSTPTSDLTGMRMLEARIQNLLMGNQNLRSDIADRDARIEALEQQMAELEGQVSEYEQLRAIEMAARRVLVHESIPLTHAVLANTLDAMTRQRAAREAAQ